IRTISLIPFQMFLLQYYSRYHSAVNQLLIFGIPICFSIFQVNRYNGPALCSRKCLLTAEYVKCFTGFTNIFMSGFFILKGRLSTFFPLIVFAHEIVYVPCELIRFLPVSAIVSREMFIFVQESDGFWWWIVAAFATVLLIIDVKTKAKPPQNSYQNETFV
ncbi:hypothetical protein PMAYCL1PPCAC_25173, partial [Pristionchus mayeri]